MELKNRMIDVILGSYANTEERFYYIVLSTHKI